MDPHTTHQGTHETNLSQSAGTAHDIESYRIGAGRRLENTKDHIVSRCQSLEFYRLTEHSSIMNFSLNSEEITNISENQTGVNIS